MSKSELENLTIKEANERLAEAKEIAALVCNARGESPEADAGSPDGFLGRFCVCRCASAGVHAGTVVSLDGDVAVLADSRRLWQWKAKAGIALSGVAQSGIDPKGSKLDALNPTIRLTGVIEVIPATAAAKESILGG